MRHLAAKKVVLALLSCILYASATKIFGEEPCSRPTYECGCNPLFCGTYTGQIHAGVAPLIWTKRSEVDLLSCQANPQNPIYQIAQRFPRFSTLYKIPWIIGGIIGYSLTDNVEIYGEFNYLQSSRKNRSEGFSFILPNVNPQQSLVLKLSSYSLVDGYIGIRYYMDRFCDLISPFMGLKIGFTAHRSVKATLSVNQVLLNVGTPLNLISASSPDACGGGSSSSPDNRFFRSNTIISGGINAGVDICFCDGWSVVVTGEFIASCGPRVRGPAVFTPPLSAPTFATNLIVGGMGSELRFPITVGIKRIF